MANPEAPPYSLLFFVNLLEQSYKNAVVSVKGHVHSSYNGTVSMDVLSVFNQEREGANFRFTLIWKNSKGFYYRVYSERYRACS